MAFIFCSFFKNLHSCTVLALFLEKYFLIFLSVVSQFYPTRTQNIRNLKCRNVSSLRMFSQLCPSINLIFFFYFLNEKVDLCSWRKDLWVSPKQYHRLAKRRLIRKFNFVSFPRQKDGVHFVKFLLFYAHQSGHQI